ncbi:enoyl-CoA hydratase/isomerase family protein [Coleofasciculus chthonoplastes]|uniref:enoyl-CoA hydratase/isomerase family protein n=1 Tax=Coleofasciculus chthonoplastes TaxID=64178 RepID=UPI003301C28C
MKQYINLTEEDTIANVHLQWSDSSSLNQMLLSDLIELMDYLEDESPCTLIVFQGLSTQQQTTKLAPPNIDHCSKWEKFLRRVESFAGASIACIDGFCTRFHFQLALACDYRVATNRSIFHAPEVKEGYLPGMSIFRLAKYTGIGAARRLLFTGVQLSASEATVLGILDRQCETTTLEKAIQESQQALMPINPEVLQNTRRLLNESFATSYEDAIGHFLAVQNLCLSQLPK